MDKKDKVNLLYCIGIQVDMMNGRLDHITKDHIEDTWFEEDLDEIILTAKQCIREKYEEQK